MRNLYAHGNIQGMSPIAATAQGLSPASIAAGRTMPDFRITSEPGTLGQWHPQLEQPDQNFWQIMATVPPGNAMSMSRSPSGAALFVNSNIGTAPAYQAIRTEAVPMERRPQIFDVPLQSADPRVEDSQEPLLPATTIEAPVEEANSKGKGKPRPDNEQRSEGKGKKGKGKGRSQQQPAVGISVAMDCIDCGSNQWKLPMQPMSI